MTSETTSVYRVVVEKTSLRDIRSYARFVAIAEDRPKAAQRWLDVLEERIASLDRMPRRFRVIDEQAEFELELRQFVHFSHRVIFHVNDETSTVHVVAVYHAARDRIQGVHLDTRFAGEVMADSPDA